LILHLSVAICEICRLYFTYSVCLVLSLKPGVTFARGFSYVNRLRVRIGSSATQKKGSCAKQNKY
jgi:hypothetical protein